MQIDTTANTGSTAGTAAATVTVTAANTAAAVAVLGANASPVMISAMASLIADQQQQQRQQQQQLQQRQSHLQRQLLHSCPLAEFLTGSSSSEPERHSEVLELQTCTFLYKVHIVGNACALQSVAVAACVHKFKAGYHTVAV
jgi:hemolysin activation/secretion protein